MNAPDDQDESVTIPIKIVKVAGWLLSAVIAGGGGSIAVRGIDPPSYDRFTGGDGRQLKREVQGWCKDKTKDLLQPIRKDIHKLEGASEQCRESLSQLPPRYLLKNMEEVQRDIALVQRTDRELKEQLKLVTQEVNQHEREAEAWKRKIEINSQWVTYLKDLAGVNK